MRKNFGRQAFLSFVAGLIFAVGLGVSGMTQPQKVIGFLQVGSDWDPSLILVMVGAILIHALSYRWIAGRPSPLFDTHWHVPHSKEINRPLIIGSALFGLGWGLGGYCPGPALVSSATGQLTAIYFVIAMLVGMGIQRAYLHLIKR